jgi:uncharacterized membrane protein (DUF2068 family)
MSAPADEPETLRPPPGPWGLRVIGTYKLVKALVLIAAGIVVLRLDPDAVARGSAHLAARLRLDPDNRLVHRALARLSGLDSTRLEEIGAGVVVYGLLYVVQGVGLLLQKRWAEYLVVVTTGFLIPVEVFEFLRRPRIVPIVVVVVNLVIVAYLVARLRRERARVY